MATLERGSSLAGVKDTTRYLRIHFAPQTACVDVEISKVQYEKLLDAMDMHDGDVTLEISCRHVVPLRVSR